MTIAQQFIADCKGKSVDEISDIEDKYVEDGLYDGDEGLYLYLDVHVYPVLLSNHDNHQRFNIEGEGVFMDIPEEGVDYFKDRVLFWLDNYSGLDVLKDMGVMDDDGNGFQMYAEWDENMDGEGGNFEVLAPAYVPKDIADELDLGSIDATLDWNLTFSWSVGDNLDLSEWTFTDGSSCDWNDLRA